MIWQASSGDSSPRNTKGCPDAFILIHMGARGPSHTISLRGCKYSVQICDDYSRVVSLFLVKDRLGMLENIFVLFLKYMSDFGIIHQSSCSYLHNVMEL